ncbi:hypothetical protein Blut17040_03360 [Blautia luti]|uniref:Uncharacterized protein n=1 Tax=Blautia luti DSM 14534 = JCM 17040 TaxID=649762 RepID=A0A844GHP5_9FIRM|nr:hypothetical protein [Blautia luti]MTD61613.1 hypothetical protein [Blautia luti DSM 14534 = JCM 17040]RHQ88887.1 hypothetical protein DWX83_15515 [Ruminococcus sp. AF21-42]BEI59307.1 hypothetical protein Blut17040_03360 [Blautia luti]
MNIPRIVNAIGYIDDDLITAALEDPPRKRYNLIIKWLSAFACLALVMIIRSVFCNSEEYKCRE